MWEEGRRQHPIDRALTVLHAFTGSGRHELAALSIPQRDALLLAARVAAFGRTFTGAIACPACGEQIEVALAVDAPPAAGERGDTSLEFGGRNLPVRAPDSFDAAAIAAYGDPDAARRELARRCLGEEEPPADLVDAADAALAQSCAFATIDCETCCPACTAAVAVPFAVDEFLWTELAWQAERLFDDIALLAQRFGWTEDAVLALSDARRERYVEYVQ